MPTEYEHLDDPFMTGSFDDSGSSLVTALFPAKGSARRYDLGSDQLVPTMLEVSDQLSPIAVRRSGDYVLDATGQETGLVVRSNANGPIVSTAIGVVASFFFALSPRGDLLATEQGGDEVVVIDVASGRERHRFEGVTEPGFPAPIPEFTPEGRYLRVRNGASAHRFDAETGELIWSTDEWGYVFPGPDDEWVATSESDGAIELRDPITLEPIGRRLVGHRTLVT